MTVALSLTPFVLFEFVCVAMGWGSPDLSVDPFVGFHGVNPLFVLNESGDRYEIPVSRQGYFRPESFAADKPRNEFRVFCLGGSTVQGRPFAIETSFTSWLEISLNEAEPDRSWEVVNCGGVSYATYRLIPILQEVLEHQPDLIILYTGHNEFLEDRTFDHIKSRHEVINSAIATASKLRSFHVLRNSWLWVSQRNSEPLDERPRLTVEVDAVLDKPGGLDAYHRDDAWRANIIEQYRFNLQRMVELIRAAGVSVILVNPVSNLRDCPPFKAEHRNDLTWEERQQWEALCAQAHAKLNLAVPDVTEATRLTEQACEIDPQHAGGLYDLARCYDRAGRFDDAKEAYLLARDQDVCPLRMLQPMHETLFEISEQSGIPLCDAEKLFESQSPNGIVDGVWLVDHVHPSIRGHQLLADSLTELLISLGIVAPQDGWSNRKQQAFQDHSNAINDIYYLKGMERLKIVEDWARGRAEGNRSGPGKSAGDTHPTDVTAP